MKSFLLFLEETSDLFDSGSLISWAEEIKEPNDIELFGQKLSEAVSEQFIDFMKTMSSLRELAHSEDRMEIGAGSKKIINHSYHNFLTVARMAQNCVDYVSYLARNYHQKTTFNYHFMFFGRTVAHAKRAIKFYERDLLPRRISADSRLRSTLWDKALRMAKWIEEFAANLFDAYHLIETKVHGWGDYPSRS